MDPQDDVMNPVEGEEVTDAPVEGDEMPMGEEEMTEEDAPVVEDGEEAEGEEDAE